MIDQNPTRARSSVLIEDVTISDQPNCAAAGAATPVVDYRDSVMTSFRGLSGSASSCTAKPQGISSHRRGRQLATWLLMALIVSSMAAWLGFIGWGILNATKLLL